jgi:hypothetical protein
LHVSRVRCELRAGRHKAGGLRSRHFGERIRVGMVRKSPCNRLLVAALDWRLAGCNAPIQPLSLWPRPVQPVRPVGTVRPVRPVGPVGPVRPVGPVGPVRPVGPVGPVRPVGPVGPVRPVRSARAVRAVRRVRPAPPVRPPASKCAHAVPAPRPCRSAHYPVGTARHSSRQIASQPEQQKHPQS